MNNDDIDSQTSVDEAKALLNAAFHSTDDARYERLIEWAEEIIALLTEANFPYALWVKSSFPIRANETITEEESYTRYLEAVRKAADAGVVEAKFALACELDEGDTREESARLFVQAADAGHAYAKWCHGLNLLSGAVVEKDRALGLAFIKESADQKFQGAIQFVSDAYAAGTYGYPEDLGEAAKWRKMWSRRDLISY